MVERDKYMSKTHVATAGGFVLAAVLAIVVHGFALHNRILGAALLAATVLMFVGALFVAKRRLNSPLAPVERPVDAPRRRKAYDVRSQLLYRHFAGSRDSARRLRRLGAGGDPRRRRGLGRVRAVPGHDLGRTDEARLRRCPAPSLAPVAPNVSVVVARPA